MRCSLRRILGGAAKRFEHTCAGHLVGARSSRWLSTAQQRALHQSRTHTLNPQQMMWRRFSSTSSVSVPVNSESEPSLLQYNQVLRRWMDLDNSQPLPVMELLEQMSAEGLKPVTSTYNIALQICHQIADAELGIQIMTRMKNLHVPRTAMSFNYLIWACDRHIERARSEGILDEKWQQGIVAEALATYDTMRVEGYSPNLTTYIKLLSLASQSVDNASKVRSLLRDVKDAGYTHEHAEIYKASMRACVAAELWTEHADLAQKSADLYCRRISQAITEDVNAAVSLMKQTQDLYMRMPSSLYNKLFQRLIAGGKGRRKRGRGRGRGRGHRSESKRNVVAHNLKQNRRLALDIVGRGMELQGMPELMYEVYLGEEQNQRAMGVLPSLYWLLCDTSHSDPVLCLRCFDLLPLAWKIGGVHAQSMKLLMNAGAAAVTQDRTDYLKKASKYLRKYFGCTLDGSTYRQHILNIIQEPKQGKSFPVRGHDMTRALDVIEFSRQLGLSFDIRLYTLVCKKMLSLPAGHKAIVDSAIALENVVRHDPSPKAKTDSFFLAQLSCAFARGGDLKRCWSVVEMVGESKFGSGSNTSRLHIFNQLLRQFRDLRQVSNMRYTYSLMRTQEILPDPATATLLVAAHDTPELASEFVSLSSELLELASDQGNSEMAVLDAHFCTTCLLTALRLQAEITHGSERTKHRKSIQIPKSIEDTSCDRAEAVKFTLHDQLHSIIWNVLDFAQRSGVGLDCAAGNAGDLLLVSHIDTSSPSDMPQCTDLCLCYVLHVTGHWARCPANSGNYSQNYADARSCYHARKSRPTA